MEYLLWGLTPALGYVDPQGYPLQGLGSDFRLRPQSPSRASSIKGAAGTAERTAPGASEPLGNLRGRYARLSQAEGCKSSPLQLALFAFSLRRLWGEPTLDLLALREHPAMVTKSLLPHLTVSSLRHVNNKQRSLKARSGAWWYLPIGKVRGATSTV